MLEKANPPEGEKAVERLFYRVQISCMRVSSGKKVVPKGHFPSAVTVTAGVFWSFLAHRRIGRSVSGGVMKTTIFMP